MTDKEMKRLSRAELLEMLLVQTRETERLQNKLKQAEELLQERNLRIQNAGDLAHAVLDLNGVMEAAQEAAQQYLENIAAMESETKKRCQSLVAQAHQEAERIRRAAQEGEPAPGSDHALLQDIYKLLDK